MEVLLSFFIVTLIFFFMPSIILACIPNKKKWLLSAIILIVILYCALPWIAHKKFPSIFIYILFLPVIAAKYIAVVQNIKGNKRIARILPVLGLVWTVVFLKVVSDNQVQDFLEETVISREGPAYKQPRHVRLNGTDYTIPRGYFRSNPAPETEEIYLNVMWPSYSALSKSERYLFHKRKQNQIISITAHDPKSIISLEKLAASRKKNRTKPEADGYQFVLKFYDLTVDQGELYIKHDDKGQIAAVLHCAADHYMYPSCQHYFGDSQIIYELRYHKEQLKDWKELQEKTLVLFEGFHNQKTEEATPKSQSSADTPALKTP